MDSTTIFKLVLFVTFSEYYFSPLGFTLFSTIHILLRLEISRNYRHGMKTSVI
jgi:hypothetical protein